MSKHTMQVINKLWNKKKMRFDDALEDIQINYK